MRASPLPVAPVSIKAARESKRRLLTEIARIEQQLQDPFRIAKFPTTAAFDSWKIRAQGAHRAFERELAYVDIWLEWQIAVEHLREAAELHAKLLADKLDFESGEMETVERIENYFKERGI